jgi:1-acyl-sn-glycerol-3-phosphate acyltransferase
MTTGTAFPDQLRSRNLFTYALGRLWMRIFGWTVEGEIPQGGKAVLIAAPHTSNWDFPFMLAAAFVLRVKLSWMGKDSLFKRPFGWLFRRLGGIPINRSAVHGIVEQMSLRFNQTRALIIAVAPSGTRSRRNHWKSGFYWIAAQAQVPIVCGYLDYHLKRAGLGPSVLPTYDLSADMDRIRAFYQNIRGRNPELETTIRLLDETS